MSFLWILTAIIVDFLSVMGYSIYRDKYLHMEVYEVKKDFGPLLLIKEKTENCLNHNWQLFCVKEA